MLALYVLSFVFCGSANKILARIASDMVRDIRRDIDEKMHRMKLGYYDTRTNGEILPVVTNDVDAINTLLGKNFYTVVTSAFTLVGVLAMLLSISVWIGLVAVAMVPATLLVSGPVMKMGAKNFAAHTEQVIQNAMATLMKGRTSFVIAHRLSTIRDANVILYMENGDIKEVGDHDALLARGGKYAELYNSQFG